MAVELRPRTAVFVLVAVLAAGTAGSFVFTETVGERAEATPEVVPINDDQRELWLFTSQAESFEQQTLAINLVVYGDSDAVRRRLVNASASDWNVTGSEEQDGPPDDHFEPVDARPINWEPATGAQRFVYLEGPRGASWLPESYQIHDGTYLGSRYHVRAYSSPDATAGWTAMQAHHEHWDWFAGRHVVTSVEAAQNYLEREFVKQPGSPEITRKRVGASNLDGYYDWLTVIDYRGTGSTAAAFVVVFLLGGIATRAGDLAVALGRRYPARDARTLLLAVGIASLFMAVRLVGIELERALDVPPKSIAFALYPAIFAGVPILTYFLARPLDRARAFGGASVGFLAAVLLDYTFLGVTQIPLDVLVDRGALAVALGLIAVGSSRPERRDPDLVDHVRFGVLLWLVATLVPLLRHTPLL